MKYQVTLQSALALLVAYTSAAPLKGIDREKIQDEYDFIIAGGT